VSTLDIFEQAYRAAVAAGKSEDEAMQAGRAAVLQGEAAAKALADAKAAAASISTDLPTLTARVWPPEVLASTSLINGWTPEQIDAAHEATARRLGLVE
jgi:hypothetical protein